MLEVVYNPQVEGADARKLRDELLKIDPDAKINSREPGLQAAVDIALPAVIMATLVVISSGLLSEVGKDLYASLKKWIKSAYETANRNPVYWENSREEPTFNQPERVETSEGVNVEPSPRRESPPLQLSYPLRDNLGRLSFVFHKEMTPQQVEEAYDAILLVIKMMVEFLDDQINQMNGKLNNSEIYRGSMPQNFWDQSIVTQLQDAARLVGGIYQFDFDQRIWLKIF